MNLVEEKLFFLGSVGFFDIARDLFLCNWKDRKPVVAELKKIYNAQTGRAGGQAPGGL